MFHGGMLDGIGRFDGFTLSFASPYVTICY